MLCQWEDCRKVFNTQMDLWTHIEHSHIRSRYECSSCNTVVTGVKEARLHAINQHGVVVSNENWTYRDGEECVLDFWAELDSEVLFSFLMLSKEA